VAFEVAAGEGAAAVLHIADVEGPFGLRRLWAVAWTLKEFAWEKIFVFWSWLVF
jgi:hypothetical protein